MSKKISLKEVKTPKLEVELLDGRTVLYDPFEMLPSLEPLLEQAKAQGFTDSLPTEVIQQLRTIFNVSKEEANDYHVVTLTRCLTELIEGEMEVKKDTPTPQS